MSFLFQISDPDEFRVTVQVSGKYNPDILDDIKTRCVAAYIDGLVARAQVSGVLPADDDEEIDEAALLRALQGLDEEDDD